MVLWVAFDMDSTLGDFQSLYNYLICLFPNILQETGERPGIKLHIKEEWLPKLEGAFYEFVTLLALVEEENRIIRPGIIPIIKMCIEAKKKGLIGGIMMYSNNNNRYMLYFANELIKRLVGFDDKVFCPMVYIGDPIRGDENKTYLKTTETIARSFLNAALRDGCGVGLRKRKELAPENILFFDDLVHDHIYKTIPRVNYFKVQPYIRHVDQKNIHNAFLYALMSQDLDRNKEYISEIKKLGFDFSDIDNVFKSVAAPISGIEKEITDDNVLLSRLRAILAYGGGSSKRRSKTIKKVKKKYPFKI